MRSPAKISSLHHITTSHFLSIIISSIVSKFGIKFHLLKKEEIKFKINQFPFSHPQSSRELENALVKQLNLLHGQSIPTMQRGPVVRFFPTAGSYIVDDSVRILEDFLRDSRRFVQKLLKL